MQIKTLTWCAIGAILLAACDEPTPPVQSRAVLEAVTPHTSGVVGELTEAAPSIRVTKESDGSPFPGVIIEFRLTNPQIGVLGARLDTSNALGIATAGSWRLGTAAGAQSLGAYSFQYGRSVGLFAIARAGPPDRILPAVTTKQYVLNGRDPYPPVVRVADKYSNAVSGFSVTYAVGAEGGSIGTTTVVTSAGGIAASSGWKIPAAANVYTVSALGAGFPAVMFSAQRVDSASLVWYGLDSLSQAGKAFLPIVWGITTSRIGLSPFDPCICVNRDGYYFERIEYTGGPSESSGGFYISGGKAFLENGDSVSVAGNTLTLKRRDYYYSTVSNWIYSRRN